MHICFMDADKGNGRSRHGPSLNGPFNLAPISDNDILPSGESQFLRLLSYSAQRYWAAGHARVSMSGWCMACAEMGTFGDVVIANPKG